MAARPTGFVDFGGDAMEEDGVSFGKTGVVDDFDEREEGGGGVVAVDRGVEAAGVVVVAVVVVVVVVVVVAADSTGSRVSLIEGCFFLSDAERFVSREVIIIGADLELLELASCSATREVLFSFLLFHLDRIAMVGETRVVGGELD
jgi:hypothetical protein